MTDGTGDSVRQVWRRKREELFIHQRRERGTKNEGG